MKNPIYSLIIILGMILFNTNSQAQEGTVHIQQDSRIEKLMEVKKGLNEGNKIGDRYVIQLYYGDNGEANNVIQKYRSLYEYSSEITYEAPNYKVWVGKFRSRLEADRALLKIKENFPAAFIPKPQRR
ncbi:SPOR domain-containing protein [Gramella sp. AN32]|uniref:SPOR domain-containing protein n=2 Tax=Christiangramia antarctica TaxID=2058158 RepID=A0ABW5X982_9FLAO|nr:SPOR domain-containing protein [Gramella sp. AN32]MCM4155350.1 translation initiation factor IF-2 [Gramella sp. AN32]